jgi:hypothetical protein
MTLVRTSTAVVRPGQLVSFLAFLVEGVRDFPDRHPAMMSDRILIDADGLRVTYETVWADPEDLVAYAGRDWATAPVTLPGEEGFLARPLELNHYELYPLNDHRP